MMRNWGMYCTVQIGYTDRRQKKYRYTDRQRHSTCTRAVSFMPCCKLLLSIPYTTPSLLPSTLKTPRSHKPSQFKQLPPASPSSPQSQCCKRRSTPPYNLQCYHQYDIPPSHTMPYHPPPPRRRSHKHLLPSPSLRQAMRCETRRKKSHPMQDIFFCVPSSDPLHRIHHLVLPVVHPIPHPASIHTPSSHTPIHRQLQYINPHKKVLAVFLSIPPSGIVKRTTHHPPLPLQNPTTRYLPPPPRAPAPLPLIPWSWMDARRDTHIPVRALQILGKGVHIQYVHTALYSTVPYCMYLFH